MATSLTLRSVKGTQLTIAEVDANFTALRTTADSAVTDAAAAQTTANNSGSAAAAAQTTANSAATAAATAQNSANAAATAAASVQTNLNTHAGSTALHLSAITAARTGLASPTDIGGAGLYYITAIDANGRVTTTAISNCNCNCTC